MQIEKLDKNMAHNTNFKNTDICWHDVNEEAFSLHGFPFYDENKDFRRLPKSIEPLLLRKHPQLVELSRHTAGGILRFCTDSRKIHVRAVLRGSAYMSHMTPVGQCGFDCYIRRQGQKDWLFAGTTKFPIGDSSYDCLVFSQTEIQSWEVSLYFPLYMGVDKVEIGLTEEASLSECSDFTRKDALAFYGTSITQGGCANRPGMAYPAILGRLLDCEAYNFGFSGNGSADPFLAPVLASLPDLGLLAVDVEDNAGPENLLEKNLPVFLDAIRETAPRLPVLIMSGARQPREIWDAVFRQKKCSWHDFQLMEATRRQEEGDAHIYFFDGRLLAMNDATVDGVHRTDLGFFETARTLLPVLRDIIAISSA